MKKRILALAVSACSLLLAVPAFSGCSSETYIEYTLYDSEGAEVETYHVSEDPSTDEAAAEAEGVEYTEPSVEAEDGYYFAVTGYSGRPKNVVIPSEYGGVPVTQIGEQAFAGADYLISVSMTDSITYIAPVAFFYCVSLKDVTLSNSLTEINYSTFAWCYSLEEIVIPDGVTSIGNMCFYGDDELVSVTLPDSVTSIGISCFYECYGLESIDLPDNLITIGQQAFYSCTALNNVVIPDSVEEIRDYAFVDCTALTDITIGSGVKIIGEYAFYYCTALESITLPADLEFIGAYAFYSCSALTDVYLTNTFSDGSSKQCRLYSADLSDYELEVGDETAESTYLYTSYNYYNDGLTANSGYIPSNGLTDSEEIASLLTDDLLTVYWYFVKK
ncbi:MAG: leucine-rich repeat domain-containing protein [Clostridia bacterium]|nr:leucine-rich repeat domain-containing protein [Clostridia bacterium]